MIERCQCSRTPSWCALKIALLDEIGFDDVFNGAGFFTNSRSKVIKTNGATIKFVDNGFEEFSVHDVKAYGVDIKHGERFLSYVLGDVAIAFDIRIVTDTPQEAVGNSGSSPRTVGDFGCTIAVYGGVEEAGAAGNDLIEFFCTVKFESGDNAKAVTQGVGEHACTGRSTNKGKGL